MNWDAISAVSEIVGAVAIVITLAYLAVQIRQGTRSTRLAAQEAATAQWHNWSNLLAGSPDLAAIVARGSESYDALNPAEALRFEAYVQMFFDSAESYYGKLTELGVIRDPGDMAVLESIVRRRVNLEGYTRIWTMIETDYGAQYRSWIDGLRD